MTPAPIATTVPRHFLQLSDWTTAQLSDLLELAAQLKHELRETGHNAPLLAGKTLACIFEKPSLRTRVSFSAGMTQLGGSALTLRSDELGFDERESTEDITRVMSGMVDGIMMRTYGQEKLERIARSSDVPIINGLTDLCHPCQALADALTLQEHFGTLSGLKIAWVGDGNNVARSLAVMAGRLGMGFTVATPPGYQLPPEDIRRIESQCPGLKINETDNPKQAVKDADCIVTDTWVSMGQEAEKAKRVTEFAGFCVDESLLAAAPARAVVLHCLPAYRGYEISAGVMESARSLVFQEAHNRLHAQKAILVRLLA